MLCDRFRGREFAHVDILIHRRHKRGAHHEYWPKGGIEPGVEERGIDVDECLLRGGTERSAARKFSDEASSDFPVALRFMAASTALSLEPATSILSDKASVGLIEKRPPAVGIEKYFTPSFSCCAQAPPSADVVILVNSWVAFAESFTGKLAIIVGHCAPDAQSPSTPSSGPNAAFHSCMVMPLLETASTSFCIAPGRPGLAGTPDGQVIWLGKLRKLAR